MEGVEDAAYYSVAVVKKSFCTADTTLRDLKVSTEARQLPPTSPLECCTLQQ